MKLPAAFGAAIPTRDVERIYGTVWAERRISSYLDRFEEANGATIASWPPDGLFLFKTAAAPCFFTRGWQCFARSSSSCARAGAAGYREVKRRK